MCYNCTRRNDVSWRREIIKIKVVEAQCFWITTEKLVFRSREGKSRVAVCIDRTHGFDVCISSSCIYRPIGTTHTQRQTRLRVYTGAWSLVRWMCLETQRGHLQSYLLPLLFNITDDAPVGSLTISRVHLQSATRRNHNRRCADRFLPHEIYVLKTSKNIKYEISSL